MLGLASVGGGLQWVGPRVNERKHPPLMYLSSTPQCCRTGATESSPSTGIKAIFWRLCCQEPLCSWMCCSVLGNMLSFVAMWSVHLRSIGLAEYQRSMRPEW